MANKADFKLIDISMKITNQLPKIVITNEIMVTVNNRKSTILNIQALAKEAEKKGDDEDQIKFMTKALSLLIGEEKTNAIEALDLPLPEYKMVYNTIMSVATGTYGEEQTPSM